MTSLGQAALMLTFMNVGVQGWWTPKVGMGWQWTIGGTATPSSPSVPIWDIDPDATNPASIKAIANRRVICYVNVGSIEVGRPDYNQFPTATIGNNYPGWPGEKFLDIRSPAVRTIMANRFQVAANKGCDAIEPDNIDTFNAPTGFPLTQADSLGYVRWLSTTAHGLGMAIGLKNNGDMVADLLPSVDFAVIESCSVFSGDCDLFVPFITAGKPVFSSEYRDAGAGGCDVMKSQADACAQNNARGFEAIIKSCGLGSEYTSCQTYDANGFRLGLGPADLNAGSGTPNQSPARSTSRSRSRSPSASPVPAARSPSRSRSAQKNPSPSRARSPSRSRSAQKKYSPSRVPSLSRSASPQPKPVASPSQARSMSRSASARAQPTFPSPAVSLRPGCSQTIAVPAYSDPCPITAASCAWKAWQNAGLVIINPNNGPETAVIPEYFDLVNYLRTSPASTVKTIVGYVYTGLGLRDIALVKAEIQRYFTFYAVDGIFLDESSDDCALVGYYQELRNYVRSLGVGTVTMMNWGADGNECFLQNAAVDIVCNFESDLTDYATYSPPSWVYNWDVSRFYHIVYAVDTAAKMLAVVSQSKRQHAQFVYATSDLFPNPYDAAPIYWAAEQQATANC